MAQDTLPNACGGLNGKEVWKGGDECMCVVDTAETNTTLQSNYTPTESNFQNSYKLEGKTCTFGQMSFMMGCPVFFFQIVQSWKGQGSNAPSISEKKKIQSSRKTRNKAKQRTDSIKMVPRIEPWSGQKVHNAEGHDVASDILMWQVLNTLNP